MKKIFSAAIAAILMLLMTACAANAPLSQQAQALLGKWGYIHDDQTAVLTLKDSGKAVFHEKEYTFDCDDTFITLTNAQGEEWQLRYLKNDESFYIYEQTTYTCEGSHDGLIGKWVSEKDHWSFEFTDKGTFDEDGYFPGHYTVDEAQGTFKLMYNDPFEDTVCYYQINGDELFVEYPWQMVKAK